MFWTKLICFHDKRFNKISISRKYFHNFQLQTATACQCKTLQNKILICKRCGAIINKQSFKCYWPLIFSLASNVRRIALKGLWSKTKQKQSKKKNLHCRCQKISNQNNKPTKMEVNCEQVKFKTKNSETMMINHKSKRECWSARNERNRKVNKFNEREKFNFIYVCLCRCHQVYRHHKVRNVTHKHHFLILWDYLLFSFRNNYIQIDIAKSFHHFFFIYLHNNFLSLFLFSVTVKITKNSIFITKCPIRNALYKFINLKVISDYLKNNNKLIKNKKNRWSWFIVNTLWHILLRKQCSGLRLFFFMFVSLYSIKCSYGRFHS